jgi:hypothetical protein
VPQPAAAAAPESLPADAAAAEAAGRLLPMHRLRLSGSARLPAAPRRADISVNFLLVQPSRSPVATRSHTAASLRAGVAASSSPAAEPPAKTRRKSVSSMHR